MRSLMCGAPAASDVSASVRSAAASETRASLLLVSDRALGAARQPRPGARLLG